MTCDRINMAEEKNKKENSAKPNEKDEKKADDQSEAIKVEIKEKPGKEEAKKQNKKGKDLKIAKERVSGLEKLPEDVQKKLEKRQAEVGKKVKAKKGKAIRKKKKTSRKVTVGKAYIKSTYNNTIVTLTDLEGNVISWASAGIAGFKGPKKSTPFAAQIITRLAVGKARENYGLEQVSVYVKGVGTGRESAIRALNNNGLIVTLIKDVTPVPHNGCRARKPRRV